MRRSEHSERWHAANVGAQRTSEHSERCSAVNFSARKFLLCKKNHHARGFLYIKRTGDGSRIKAFFISHKLWRSPCIRFIISFYRHSRFLINTSQVRNLRLVASGLRPGLYLLCLRAAYACADLASAAAGLASAAFLAGFFFFL